LLPAPLIINGTVLVSLMVSPSSQVVQVILEAVAEHGIQEPVK
jgi:hypothetical protein